MIRVAAVGDVHVGPDSAGIFREQLASVHDRADVLLLAGDLTKSGAPDEAEALAVVLGDVRLDVVGVLGNHDHHSDQEHAVARILRDAGVVILEGDGTVVETGNGTVGIAGVKGFAGGFTGASGSEFGEQEMKVFIRHTKERADALERALAETPEEAFPLEAEDGRYTLTLSRVVYVKRFSREGRVGFHGG